MKNFNKRIYSLNISSVNELKDEYEFGYTTVFGKKGLTIKKKNGKNS